VIEVSWANLDNQEVLLYRFPSFWTWDDFYKSQRKIDKMLDLSSQSIPVFFDFRNGSYLPPGMLREMSNIIDSWHPRGMPLVVIGGNQIVQNAFSVAARMLNASNLLNDVLFVASMPAAEALVRRKYEHELT
jgi:hypothetical protein